MSPRWKEELKSSRDKYSRRERWASGGEEPAMYPQLRVGLVGTEKRRAQVINRITKKHSAEGIVNM